MSHPITKWVRGEAPGFLVDSIKQNYDPPSAFVSKADLEERARARKQSAQELSHDYEQQKQQVIEDIEAVVKMAPEQRVAGILDAWEITQRKLRRAPTPEDRALRQAHYIQGLPSKEKLLADKFKELQNEFETRAKEQGIEITFP